MANTSYLRYHVEPWVREELSRRLGADFSARVLVLKTGGRHEFDAVSMDGGIVASIKANSGLTSGGKQPTGKVATCLNEVYYLTLVDAPRRFLVLTNPEFYDIFVRTTAGKIADGVDIVLVPLLAEMQATVDGITRAASAEMSRESGVIAAAVEAEEAGERGQDIG